MNLSSRLLAGGPTNTAGSWRRWKEAGLGYLLLVPALAVFGVFVFYPFLKNFQLALYVTPPEGLGPGRFVGLHQATQVLGSSEFRQSLWTTVIFVFMVVPAGVLGGLVLAVIANQRLRGIRIFQVIFSSTVATSVAVSTVIFGTLMNPIVGLLPWLGINPTPSLLENSTWALPSIAVITVWQFLGLSFIVMLAGLQSLPEEVLEAARIDGASTWTRFWRVTVPLLSPTIFFAVVVGSISAFQTFGQINILIPSGQAPTLHVNTLVYYAYTALNTDQNPGVGAVISIALFVITLLLTLVQLRFLERRVHYAR